MLEVALQESYRELGVDGFNIWLLDKLKNISTLDQNDRNALYFFLLQHGYTDILVEHCCQLIQSESGSVPWAYLFSAFQKNEWLLPSNIWEAILFLLQSPEAQYEAIKVDYADIFLPPVVAWREAFRGSYSRKIEAEKDRDFEQLQLLRAQQLIDKERELLFKLQKKYPNDPDSVRALQRFRERYAEEIILKHKPRKSSSTVNDTPEETLDMWRKIADSWVSDKKQSIDDIIVAFIFMDLPEVALELWQKDGSKVSWLGAHLLLETNRFVELLAILPQLEQQNTNDPETFFASTFFRAQALWGLGQRENAIEVLEALLTTRPDYRSARELLQTWRNQS